jgi:hypothetical protein
VILESDSIEALKSKRAEKNRKSSQNKEFSNFFEIKVGLSGCCFGISPVRF